MTKINIVQEILQWQLVSWIQVAGGESMLLQLILELLSSLHTLIEPGVRKLPEKLKENLLKLVEWILSTQLTCSVFMM